MLLFTGLLLLFTAKATYKGRQYCWSFLAACHEHESMGRTQRHESASYSRRW